MVHPKLSYLIIGPILSADLANDAAQYLGTGSSNHNVYKTVCLSEDLLVFSLTIRAVWADDGDRPLLL
jgi:hypothetical protein